MDRPVDFTSVLGLVYKDVALRLGLMTVLSELGFSPDKCLIFKPLRCSSYFE